jgi:hypothetical protein
MASAIFPPSAPYPGKGKKGVRVKKIPKRIGRGLSLWPWFELRVDEYSSWKTEDIKYAFIPIADFVLLRRPQAHWLLI